MKTQYLVFLSLLAYITSNGQGPNWDWARGMGGNSGTSFYEDGYGTAADAAGNVYVTGSFNSATVDFGSITLTNFGNSNTPDFYIAKYDANGNILWAKRAGASGDDVGLAITTDGSGNIYCAGYFTTPTITFGTAPFLTNAGVGTADIFVVKYNPSGNVLWARSAGSGANDKGLGITADPFGSIYVTGYFGATFVYGTTPLANMGGNDIFISKYDGSGNLIWATGAGGGAADESYGIATDTSGDVYIAGEYFSSPLVFGSFPISNFNTNDIFVAKYSSLGAFQWVQRAGSAGNNYCKGIAGDHLGNVVITGSYTDTLIIFGNTILNSQGNDDVFTVKYDASGNVLWAKGAGSSNKDEAKGITCDIIGDAYITGDFAGPSIYFGTHGLANVANGYYDIFATSYDSSGNVQWARSAGGSSGEKGSGIATALNNVYVTGHFQSPMCIFDTTNVLNTGSAYWDMFIGRLDPAILPTGVHEIKQATDLFIYPNPTAKFFLIKGISSDENYFLQILNPLGEIVFAEKLSGRNEYYIQPDLTPGIYIIEAWDGEKNIVKKLVIE